MNTSDVSNKNFNLSESLSRLMHTNQNLNSLGMVDSRITKPAIGNV